MTEDLMTLTEEDVDAIRRTKDIVDHLMDRAPESEMLDEGNLWLLSQMLDNVHQATALIVVTNNQ